MINYDPNLKIFTSGLIDNNNYFSGFSTIPLGDSRNPEVIGDFFKKINPAINKIIVPQQIHSVNITQLENNISQNKIQIIKDSDGLITKLANTAIIVRTADCIPLIICDKKTRLIGISHQGWRGSLKNMSAKMVASFLDLGSKVENLVCSIGPAIGACCYEIGRELSSQFLSEYKSYSRQIILPQNSKPHLSLNQLNYLQLIKAGVKRENIDFLPFCTKCDSKRFFSRRRSKSNNFGKIFSFIYKM